MTFKDERAVSGSEAAGHARLKVGDVLDLVQMSRSYLYDLMKKERFPRPVKQGKSSRWVLGEVLLYLKQQEDARV